MTISKQRKKGMYSSVHEKSVFGQFMNDWMNNIMKMKPLGLDSETSWRNWMQNGMIWVRGTKTHMHMMKDMKDVMVSSGWMNITKEYL